MVAMQPQKAKIILIVEDDPSILEVMELLLIPKGYTVVTATGGSSFYEAIHGVLPDLVIMDVTLPDGNGVELTKFLKSNPKTQAIPVIMTTAVTSPHEKAHLAGADSFIAKPFDINVFEQVVQDFLND